MFRISLILFLAFMLSGCFHIAMFFKDHIIDSPIKDKGISTIYGTYIGLASPLAMWVEDKDGKRAKLKFDTLREPSASEIEELFLSQSEYKEIQKKADEVLRNYFGGVKQIKLHIMIQKREELIQQSLLDAQIKNRGDTVVENLVKAGLVILNDDIVISGRMRHLAIMQGKAQRSRLGFWKKIKATNPKWHD